MRLRVVPPVMLALSGIVARATKVRLPDLTRDTIVGVWEAIGSQPLPTMIERIEIAKDGPGFFAYSYAESPASVQVFRMISCEVSDGKIALKFRGTSPTGSGTFDWFFEGHGQGTAETGAMKGRLFTQVGPPPQRDNVTFIKGSWTRSVADASHRNEEGIAKARGETTK